MQNFQTCMISNIYNWVKTNSYDQIWHPDNKEGVTK